MRNKKHLIITAGLIGAIFILFFLLFVFKTANSEEVTGKNSEINAVTETVESIYEEVKSTQKTEVVKETEYLESEVKTTEITEYETQAIEEEVIETNQNDTTINVEIEKNESTEAETEKKVEIKEEKKEEKKEETEDKTKEDTITGSAVIKKMKLAKKTEQIVTVIAKGTSAKVVLWEKDEKSWKKVFSTNGYVGKAGIGPADEYHSYTPEGAYSLGFAFGTVEPETDLEFRKITKKSYWISNVDDPDYNTWQERESSSSKDEHLIDYSKAYKYSIVINYNKECKPGKGSAFFLHCSTNGPTAGCVSIPEKYMKKLLKRLHPGAYIVNVKSEQDLLDY